MTFTYRVLLKPKDILFKENLLPSSFDNGISLRETLQQLINDEILLEDIPTIDVVWCKQQWAWYTFNHRRLWVFRELEKLGRCQYIATKRIDTIEHVINDNVRLYGSAELIGESTSVVRWDSEDGLQISLFGQRKKNKTVKPPKEDRAEVKRRNWRERTPLTVKITWDKQDATKSTTKTDINNCTKSSITEDEIKRERKDSGFSEISRTSSRSSVIMVEKSRAYDDESSRSTNSESVNEDACSEISSKGNRRRRSKFRRYQPYSRPECSDSSTTSVGKEKLFKKRQEMRYYFRKGISSQRKKDHDRWLFILHHGNRPRLEQLALKTKLMNTCGFCYKSFQTGVSLSQHIEELKHWACIRCSKYFSCYTALGQHVLSLDHCSV